MPDLRLVLVPPQGTGAKSAVAPAAEPLPQAWVEQHVSGRPALTRPVPPVPASGRTAEAVVQEANPRAEAPLSTATATGVVPAESPLRADRPGDTALSPVPGPDVIALAPSDEANWDVPAAPATPAPVNAPASDTSNPVNAMPPFEMRAMPCRRESIKKRGRESLNRPSSILPSSRDRGRRSSWKRHDWRRRDRRRRGWRPNDRRPYDRQEAARQEAARQEAARQEAARQEAARQEAARQETARQEAARQETARQETARQEAARQEAARQEAARQEKRRDKRRRDKRRRDKRRRDKRRRDKRRRDKRQRDKRRRDKRRHDKRRHGKRRPADGRRYFGRSDDSWTRRPPGVKWRRPQRASYPCRAAHVEAGSSVAPTPTRNSSCTRKRGAEKSS